MGVTDPSVVTALFANFAPAMVERRLPSAWKGGGPRRAGGQGRGVAAASAGSTRPTGPSTEALVPVLDLLDRAANDDAIPRPPAAAAGPPPAGPSPEPTSPRPAMRAWPATTVLREQRGDAHVAAVANAGLDGCEARSPWSAPAGCRST